ncbi:MAG: permease [Flavobacteriales bacterium]|nr:permease [Flavobacteriia bacterium]NCP04732.1 permease [Flavobacteriales bacterium]PIV94499.1 MAG: permease [Flavobacteriaceae bacterium CG17_big_fil_post_rev_8_21_14_2_50_33_15]PIY10831.1 MAG: permease [Flavobacteriaceae bacterium CG_4_10_14_3_um_filter_33_47]PJB17028.1 MAG: permease [Flavobacteriaceae bacterium CG_4_9_14_3_um_filter_33_16]
MFDWIQNLADWLIYSVLGIHADTHLGTALNFFVYDTLKILILLFIIVFLMGIVNTYFPIEKLKDYLHRKKLYGLEYFFASIFGAITPFCSCSSVPLFIGFVQGGIPLGVTFAFLITSPLVNEVAIAMFIGLFGWKATLIYAGSGILLGTIGGWLLGKFNLEPLLSDWVKKILEHKMQQGKYEEEKLSFRQRLPEITQSAWDIVKGVLWYVIIGIAVGAAMHGYVPENFFGQYLGGGEWWTVPIAVLFAVPMYANAAGIVPVIEVFVAKGVPLGTAIAFMMATVGLSIPEATLLKKVMTMKLIAIYFGVVTLFIMLSGFLFNILL